MPRPSLKDAKSKEILDAFVRCAARFGLDGSTLERIADEAGIQRPMIRHYLGNRDQMIAKLLEHVNSRFDEMTNQLFLSEAGIVHVVLWGKPALLGGVGSLCFG